MLLMLALLVLALLALHPSSYAHSIIYMQVCG